MFGFNALFGLDIGPPREGAERVLQFTFLRTLRNPSKKEAPTWVCLKAFTPKQRNGVHFFGVPLTTKKGFREAVQPFFKLEIPEAGFFRPVLPRAVCFA